VPKLFAELFQATRDPYGIGLELQGLGTSLRVDVLQLV
jgi:hypothetical protein